MQVSAVGKIFADDPQGAVQALAAAVQCGIVLPGCRMKDDWHGTGKMLQSIDARSHAAAAVTAAGSSAGSQCSRLYIDWMAAADAVGVYTINDTAAAVEQCCEIWQVRSYLGSKDMLVGTIVGTGIGQIHLV